MNAKMIVKKDTEDLHTEKQRRHLAKKSKTQLLAEIPEESVWLANFISRHTKKTYIGYWPHPCKNIP